LNAQTEYRQISGPAGELQLAIDLPGASPIATAVICHPHPVYGGTMDNKVVQTLARAFLQLGCRTVRFNFRGIGQSAGAWDEGRGEVDDAMAVIAAERTAGLPLVLAGFSFGGYVASQAAARLAETAAAEHLVLIAPATSRFDVAQVPAGTVIVHGESDDVVPLASTLDWARPQHLPVTVVPGVGHFFHGQLPLLKALVVNAFAGRPLA